MTPTWPRRPAHLTLVLATVVGGCRPPAPPAHVAPSIVPASACADPAPTPPFSSDATLTGAAVYDLARDRVVYVPGVRNAPPDARFETWVWDGRCWHAMPLTDGPAPRYGHTLAYDTRRARTVLFGGVDARTEAGATATWEWDGVAWRAAETATGPSPRVGHAMAYDPVRGVTIVAGGLAPNQSVNDRRPERDVAVEVWAWDGVVWRALPDLATLHGPPRMFFSEAAGTVLVHDGSPGRLLRLEGEGWRAVEAAGDGPPVGARCFAESSAPHVCASGLDVYALDARGWTQGRASVSPPLLAYDPRRGVALGFGTVRPATASGDVADPAWMLRGAVWQPLPSQPLPSARSVTSSCHGPQDGAAQ